ncbi:uncharacterized protein KY384_005890 [Bacidia gigantensis]|uniref:uncharacterized protein n=1 Tax=Bacidia gigantensis TaxID=2732470 RepID=UPI001D052D0E|nr:uncharacterized protein KY384_005890 [Bacidia gigantensis]KAG8529255.1 hypothetical protein KY384_005890 [Bacidia gigantensis]
MAPMKRHQSSIDDGHTEILDVESAQSSLQQASRKRARLLHDEIERFSSTEASNDEDFDEEQATQFATQQNSKPRANNKAADNGIIEMITCSNFMCHTHLEMKLGPLINFVIGHNGSGKSAVLTAITICLGGKASSTNRGQSLKSFIKEGQESAMLSVKIKNFGQSAYQHDAFGDAIFVERHFSRSGSSAFKLKNWNGKLISNKKSDLDEMCDYFALQIDNPMNVLSQDMARQFLNNSSPQEKYKFFMKGTQLEHLDGDYLIVEQTLDVIDTELHKKAQDFEVFDDQAKKAQELLQLSEQQDVIREKIDMLTQKLAWIQVEDQEAILKENDLELRRLDDEISRLEAESASYSESFDQTEQSKARAEHAVEMAKQTLTPLEEEHISVKDDFDKNRKEASGLQAEQRSIGDEIKTVKKRIETLRAEIDDEHRRLSEADGGKNAERRLELEHRQEKALQAKQRGQDHDEDLPKLEENVRKAKSDREESKEQVDIKRQAVRQADGRLGAMQRDSGEQLNGYSSTMPRLLKAIRQDDTLRNKPVGPIGSHVRLLKPAWSSILEKQFGGALDSFIVTSKEDQSKLSALMQRCNCVCPILIGNDKRLNTSDHEPGPEFETWMRVLEIDDELVRNSLIISQGIDQTILITNREEALSTMNGDRIRNVRQCFTHNKRRGQGIRFGYGFGGGLSESFIPAFNGAPRMKTDLEYQIRSVIVRVVLKLAYHLRLQKSDVQDLKNELHGLEKLHQEKQAFLVQCEQLVGKHKKAAKEMIFESQRAQGDVEELQDALDQDAVEEGRLEALKEQVTEANEEEELVKNSYGDAVVALDNVKHNLKEVRANLSRLDDAVKEAEAHVFKAESKVTQCSNKRAGALHDKNTSIEAVESAQREKARQLNTRQQQDETVLEFTREANRICGRVPIEPGETETALENKYKKLERDLNSAQERTGDRAEIARNACKAFESRDRAKEEIERTETLAQRTLDLHVEPDETRKSGQGHTTHGLSGGEKSFSTICLLLSIWEAMGAPIRCLDEFDVFMDNINREISMGMMIQFARNSPGKQFVLISPQQANTKNHGDDVKIIKMSDPERGQQTLNFAAQAA